MDPDIVAYGVGEFLATFGLYRLFGRKNRKNSYIS
jgi:hypothetical protein